MLASFFKPKWQHPKAEKRVKAVSKMRASSEKKLAILSKLALEDSDERVRVVATEKLSNLDLLIKISKSDSSEITRDQALHNISKILLSSDGPNIDEKLNVLNSLTNSAFLSHIALNSNDKELREQAIEQLEDSHALLTIAEKSQRASIRALAAERITCPEALEQLNKFARNKDNGVYKITRDKLQQLKDEEKELALINENVNKLLEAIQLHSSAEYFPLYAAKLSALENEWSELSSKVDGKQCSLFTKYVDICKLTIAKEDAKEKALFEAAAAKEQAIADKNHTLKEFTALKQASQNFLPEQDQIENLEKQLSRISRQWERNKSVAAKGDIALFDKTNAQLGNLCHCFRIYMEQIEEIKTLTSTLKALEGNDAQLASAQQKGIQITSKLSWPKEQAKPSELISLEEALNEANLQLKKQNEHSRQLRDELTQLLGELEDAIKKGEIRNADKKIKRAEQLSKRMNGSLTSALENRMKTLNSELQEIRDWQSYAVTPKKEALCDEMEALVNSELPVQERASKIRKVQKEWKALDATDANHSQKLWKRFKQASDQAYAPCDQYFSEQKEVRAKNLQLREQLCQQLEVRCAKQDTVISDWKAYEEEIKQIKQEWRSYSPVDRSPGKKLQSQFDALIAQLDAPLKDFRDCNAKIKKALLEETKALLETEISFESTEKAKALQKQWKETGQAPRNQERRLWSQFRENCNQIFEAYYANKAKLDNNSIKNLEELVLELEEAIESASQLSFIEQRTTQATNLLNALKKLDSKASQGFETRLESITDFVNGQQQKLSRFNKEPYLSLSRKAQLCDQLEYALIDGDNGAAETAIEGWQAEQNHPSALAENISSRFSTLLLLTEDPDELENIIHEQELKLRELCIRLEIATSTPTPIEDQALRMEYQMSRLQQALDSQEKAFDLAEIKQLEFEWMCVPFANHFEELHDRFDQLLRQIL